MTRFEQNDTIITIEKQLQTELFNYQVLLGGVFNTVDEQMEMAEKIGELAKAVRFLRQARSHMTNI